MGMLISDYRRDAMVSTAGMGSALDIWNWKAPGPCEVVRFGVISGTTAFLATATSSFTIRADLNAKTSGSTGGFTRTSGAVGTLNTTTSASVGQVGNGIYTNTSSPISVRAGEEVIFAVTSAASAGQVGRVFIEYRDLPWQEIGRPTTAPGDGTPASNGLIANMINVTP